MAQKLNADTVLIKYSYKENKFYSVELRNA